MVDYRVNLNSNRTDHLYWSYVTHGKYCLPLSYVGAARLFTVPGLSYAYAYFTLPTSLD